MNNTNFLAITVPSGQGELIHVETLPLAVEPNIEFEEAKQALEVMLKSSRSLANSITTDDDYNRGMEMIKGFKTFLRNVEDGVTPTKDRLNQAKNRLMELIHQLDEPAKQILLELSRETGRYKVKKDEEVRIENDRLRREAEEAQRKKQHAVDIECLRVEIGAALDAANAANGRGQKATATEILNNIVQIEASLKVPESIRNPLETSTLVRQYVALAIQHEEARIAAAAAKRDGDAKAAKEILNASKNLELPEVEEVQQETVEIEPTVMRGPDLKHMTGASVSQAWRVKRTSLGAGKEKVTGITDPQRICREHPELCEPSVSKIDDYAKRTKEKPIIPGVTFELETKTRGVR